jgi:hypothetical protein
MPQALKGGANRHFKWPWFVPQVAGFQRAPVQIQDLKKDDLPPPPSEGCVCVCVCVCVFACV